ncbi:arylamine N-acetyltransferase family protein [Prauserella cavernicola]|uniref:Arylamine N-acetyltransferase n=1 Tax=Prauserella cavernicola TaxID=2800127 RepID=A0A934QN99_9PSEU|nr:arylamine N-acetyltransferase [Prauserella cavernicola]MBK1782689.1 arylamine N-acetyltransferase [Prauserella cavernicola]
MPDTAKTVNTTTRPGGTEVWHSDDLDLDAYLDRLGLPHTAPSAAALSDLHAAHVHAIPFENIDPLLGRSPSLALGDIADKLVRRRRGGYCYEHNLLFAAALEQLGYDVHRQAARVQPDHPGPNTHMNLRVRVDGADFLADVGFGASVMRPMPLTDGSERDQAGWPHRLIAEGAGWRLDKLTDGMWETQYSFDATAQYPIDYEVFNHYVATHPRSPFTGRLVVMRLSEGICRKIIGGDLVVEHADGPDEHRTIEPDQLGETLRSLDLDLSPAELDLVRERYAGTE